MPTPPINLFCDGYHATGILFVPKLLMTALVRGDGVHGWIMHADVAGLLHGDVAAMSRGGCCMQHPYNNAVANGQTAHGVISDSAKNLFADFTERAMPEPFGRRKH